MKPEEPTSLPRPGRTPDGNEQDTVSLLKLLLAVVLAMVFLGGVLFGSAGRIDLPWFWATLGALLVPMMVISIWVLRTDPGLFEERLRPGKGTPLWDRVILGVSGLLFLTNFVLAAVDVERTHWTEELPATVRGLGLAGILSGLFLMAWAMKANTFFSKIVRFQEDRGHRVVNSGPYRFVRHPGYLGWIIAWTGCTAALGSLLGIGMSIVCSLLFVLRTALEDRFLHRKLKGYPDYAGNVRWRLLPYIW